MDTDVSKEDRAKALTYLKTKYGHKYVCQIVNYNRYGLKNTIKALLSASRGFTAEYQNEITSSLPKKLGDLPITYENIINIVNDPDKYLGDEIVNQKQYEECCHAYNVLQGIFVKYPEVKKALERLKNAVASLGLHAGGVIVSSKPIGENIALMKGSDTAIMPVCQADMDALHYINAL